MAARKTGLGNGLSALFADNSLDMSKFNSGEVKDVSMLRISHIEPKKSQPRKDFNKEALAELADSIAKLGIIQPIVVRGLPNGYYQIIAGERRWRAAKMAGLDTVPVVIKNVDDLIATQMTMVENLQREDLNPIEEAMGYKYLADTYNLTQEEIARQVAKSRSVVANALRLLALPDKIVKYIEEGEMTPGHARTLLALDDSDEQLKLAERIIKNGLSVRETEKIVKAIKIAYLSGDVNNADAIDEAETKTESEMVARKAGILAVAAVDKIFESSKRIEEMYIKSLQSKISDIFGKKVSINITKKDGAQSGKLEIEYKTNDELESIIKVLCGEDSVFEN